MKTRCLLLSAATLLCLSGINAFSQPSVKSIVKKNMRSLSPYAYDCYAAKEVTFGAKEQSLTVEFSLYSDEDYKLLFCKTELPQSVDIYIYDGNPKNKKSKLLYFDDSGKKDPYVCNFRPSKTGQYFIVYKVPAASAPNQKGSIVVLIGVKDGEGSLAKK